MTRVWVYTKVCIFSKRCFKMFLKSLFWKCLWSVVFDKKENVFSSWSQVTKSFVYPYCTQRFSLFFQPFLTILFHHWIWWTILRLGSLFRTGAGHRMDHECNGAKCLWQFALKGLWSFHLGNFRKRHRGTYDHLNLFCQRYSTCKHGPFLKATCGITLGMQVCIVFVFQACLSWIRSS